MNITEDQAQKEKIRQRKITFEPAAPVGGTSSIDMFHLLVSLAPCYPACHLLPTLVHRGFPSTPPVPSAPRIPLVGFPSTPPVVVPPPVPLGTTHGGFPAPSTQLCLILVPHHHEPFGCFKDPPVPLPRLCVKCERSETFWHEMRTNVHHTHVQQCTIG